MKRLQEVRLAKPLANTEPFSYDWWDSSVTVHTKYVALYTPRAHTRRTATPLRKDVSPHANESTALMNIDTVQTRTRKTCPFLITQQNEPRFQGDQLVT